MRISDWRSDVCSSDLRSYLPFLVCGALGLAVAALCRAAATAPVMLWAAAIVGGIGVGAYLAVNLALAMRTIPEGRAGDRKSVVEGKSVSVRVDLGGRCLIKKKKHNHIPSNTTP